MSQTTTDKFQMLSRLSHVDEVQYKRWNYYKVHEALNTRVIFRRHLDFFPLVPGFLQGGGDGGAWGGGGGGGGWADIGEEGSRLKVLFCSGFLVFSLECQLCQELSLFVPFQKDGSILKTLKQ